MALITITAPAGPISGDDAQRAARQELQHAVYHRDDQSWLDRAGGWLGDQATHLVNASPSGSLLLVVVGMLVVGVSLAVVRAGRPRRAARARADAGADPLRPATGTDHRRLAEQLAASGKRADALREWVRSAVSTIEERGILEVRPGRTGAEVARAAGAALPDARDQLLGVIEAFDEVWFGGRCATDADVALGREAADAVVAARVAPVATSPTPYAVPR